MCWSIRASGARRTLFRLLPILIVASGCGGTPEAEAPPRLVRTEQVFPAGGARVRTFSGTARAGLESRLSFKVSGTVSRIHVKVGDVVRQGDVLAQLDASDYRLQVEDTQASLERASAEARNAAAGLERVRALYENNNASQNDLDAARAAHESASANVKSIEKRLALARNQVAYTRLVAPVDGAIAEVAADPNENVQAGQTVVVLSSGSRPEVEVAIPEGLIGRIRSGQKVTVTFDALEGRVLGATVFEVGVAPTGIGTTYPVTLRLDAAAPEIRPGMAAEVHFRFESRGAEERLVIPAYAVGEDREGRFVWVVEPTEDGMGVVHRRGVRVGDLASDGIEILEGLRDGEHVVTAGVSRIVEGQRVRFEGAAGPSR